jgi:hypothetical protein
MHLSEGEQPEAHSSAVEGTLGCSSRLIRTGARIVESGGRWVHEACEGRRTAEFWPRLKSSVH